MRYGFLTFLNGTYFIRREEEHAYAFTNAIFATDEDPTCLEMLLCKLGPQAGARRGSHCI